MKQMKIYFLITTFTVIGIGLLIVGGVIGNPLLIGAGFAGLLMVCGAFISSKRRTFE